MDYSAYIANNRLDKVIDSFNTLVRALETRLSEQDKAIEALRMEIKNLKENKNERETVESPPAD